MKKGTVATMMNGKLILKLTYLILFSKIDANEFIKTEVQFKSLL